MTDAAVEQPIAPNGDDPDHTVDPEEVNPGQIVFEYGYVPVVVFGVQGEQLEVGRFAGTEYVSASDCSTHRGALPESAMPAPESPTDRIAALENQVAALLDVIKGSGVPAPTEVPTEPTKPEAQAVESPFQA